MRYNNHFLVLIIALIITSCGSVYKKHYDNGYTIIKHKKKGNEQLATKPKDIQQKSVNELSFDLQTEKQIEQKKAEKTFQTYHKSLNKIENNAPGRVLTSINKLTLNKIESLKADTVYRKAPAKEGNMSSDVDDKAQTALILSIVSIGAFFLLWFLSLIPAIIALSMVKKAKAMAKLSGQEAPSNANTAKILAWVTIGLNVLSLLLILLYILFIILLFATI